QVDQLLRERSYLVDVTAGPTKVRPDVAAIGPTQFRKRLRERGDVSLRLGIAFVVRQEHADPPHAVALLRSRSERPCRCAADERDEFAPAHSITSSARASRVGGTMRPIAFAALRLMTSSYLTGACTGRSPGFSPLRMRSTYWAAERNWLARSDPYDIKPPAVPK